MRLLSSSFLSGVFQHEAPTLGSAHHWLCCKLVAFKLDSGTHSKKFKPRNSKLTYKLTLGNQPAAAAAFLLGEGEAEQGIKLRVFLQCPTLKT